MNLTANAILQQAYAWICSLREKSSHNNNIWNLQYNWVTQKPQLQHQLVAGKYHFSLLRSYKKNGEFISGWETMDALVSKALSLILQSLVSTDYLAILVKTKRQLLCVIKLTHIILNRIKLKMPLDKYLLGAQKKDLIFFGVYLVTPLKFQIQALTITKLS